MAGPSKHHNMKFDAGSGIPYAAGDYYYSQDLIRDFRVMQDLAGNVLADILGGKPVIISGGVVTQTGGPADSLEITACIGYALFSVEIPDSFASLPPSKMSVDIIRRIVAPAKSAMGATVENCTWNPTLDGGTPNYVKLRYKEGLVADETRNRAKAAGSYVYAPSMTYLFVVDAIAPTDYDIVLDSFIGAPGGVWTFSGSGSMVARTVCTQAEFNALFVRVAANHYHIRPQLKSLFLKNGAYLISGILSGGDTWGYIQTNNCVNIEFESGAYLDCGDTAFYLEVNTDDCYLKNVYIKGAGGAAALGGRSFLLNALRVTYDNCKTSGRNSTNDFVGFQGSGTALHNITGKYIDCLVFTISGTDKIYGFRFGRNLDGCVVYDINGNGDSVYGISCLIISSCRVYDIVNLNGDAFGFFGCNSISGCYADMITATGGAAIGFYSGNSITGCYAITITSTDMNAIGFSSGDSLSGCYTGSIICGARAGDIADGFLSCTSLSGCHAKTITGGAGGTGYGFNGCHYMSACYAESVTGSVHECFHLCSYISSTLGDADGNTGNSRADTSDDAAGPYSTPPDGTFWT